MTQQSFVTGYNDKKSKRYYKHTAIFFFSLCTREAKLDCGIAVCLSYLLDFLSLSHQCRLLLWKLVRIRNWNRIHSRDFLILCIVIATADNCVSFLDDAVLSTDVSHWVRQHFYESFVA